MLQVFDKSGRDITDKHATYLRALHDEIWMWRSTEWADALSHVEALHEQREDVLRTKAEAFWEHNAQWASERVFGHAARTSAAVYLFGPSRLDRATGRVRP